MLVLSAVAVRARGYFAVYAVPPRARKNQPLLYGWRISARGETTVGFNARSPYTRVAAKRPRGAISTRVRRIGGVPNLLGIGPIWRSLGYVG